MKRRSRPSFEGPETEPFLSLRFAVGGIGSGHQRDVLRQPRFRRNDCLEASPYLADRAERSRGNGDRGTGAGIPEPRNRLRGSEAPRSQRLRSNRFAKGLEFRPASIHSREPKPPPTSAARTRWLRDGSRRARRGASEAFPEPAGRRSASDDERPEAGDGTAFHENMVLKRHSPVTDTFAFPVDAAGGGSSFCGVTFRRFSPWPRRRGRS